MEGTKRPKVRPLPLHFAKIVEERRKSRFNRARQLAMNVEYQRAVLDTTEQYIKANQLEQNKIALNTTLGPAVARVVHEVNMQHTQEQRERSRAATNLHNEAVERQLARRPYNKAEVEAHSASVQSASWEFQQRPTAGALHHIGHTMARHNTIGPSTRHTKPTVRQER